MLVNRRTFIIKSGHYDEAVALLVEAREKAKSIGNATARIYASEVGTFDVVVFETDHENFAAYERDWETTLNHPTLVDWVKEWFQRWDAVTEAGGTNEIWRVVE
jgi:UDP-N-acetyl-D-mannosaminuronate dehydrogenase